MAFFLKITFTTTVVFHLAVNGSPAGLYVLFRGMGAVRQPSLLFVVLFLLLSENSALSSQILIALRENKAMKPAFVFSDHLSPRLSRHILFWLVWVAFFTFIYGFKGFYYYGKSLTFLISFVDAICFLPLHLFFSYIILYFIIPRYLYTQRYLALLCWMLAVIAAAGIMSYLCAEFLVVPVRTLFGVPRLPSTVAFGFMGGLRGGLTIGGFAAAIKLMKQWYIKKQENEALQKARIESELQILKAQLHPHFLFNTLNNIYSYAMQDTNTAPGMILRLSDMLRYMLYECEKHQVPLAREVQLVKDYVSLEQMRYGDRLDVHIYAEGDLSSYHIAPLLLLPFVENSFKHGASHTIGTAWISIDLRVENAVLKLKVINGKSTPAPPESDQGIGLKNVRQRLELLYPNAHVLNIFNQEDSFIVKLALQLERAVSPASPSNASTGKLYYV